MGSIQYIYNPEKWKIVFEGKSKILDGDKIYKMVIGYCDDYLSSGEIIEFISKENYEKLLDGTYIIKKFPYNEHKIVLLNNENNIIPLVKENYDKKYEEGKKEYIKRLKK